MNARRDTEIIDTGNAPEFFVTHVAKWEPVMDSDCIRIYACAARPSGKLLLQYTVIVPRHCLAAILGAGLETLTILPRLVPSIVAN